ncbi:MAG: DedA family protein [Bacteroidales bacterium]|nr:DedA family protein [Candidatus Liminaster caballi]
MEDLSLWGYPGLFVAAFLAGTPFPMNSEVVLSALLLMKWPVVPCVLVATVGNWAGALVNYFLGRLCTYDQMLRWTRANPRRLEKVKNFLTGRGTWFALGSCLPIIGNVLIISYGILRAPFWKVTSIMAIGQLLRYIVWTAFTLGAIGFVS